MAGPKLSLFVLFFGGCLFSLSLLSCFVFCKKTSSSPKRASFAFFFGVSLCFSLAFVSIPFLTLSFSVSLSCYFFVFFLPCFFFIICFLLVICFRLCVFLPCFLVLFHEKNNIKILNYKVVVINPFCSVGLLSFLSFRSLFLVFVVSRFSVVFCNNINVLSVK